MTQWQSKRWTSSARVFLWGGCVVALLATVLFVVRYRSTRTSLEKSAFNNARQQASSAAVRLTKCLAA